MRKAIQLVLIGFVIIVIGLFGLVRYLEATSVFYASRIMQGNPSQMQLPYEDIYFKTSDGLTLNGWLVKSPSAKSTVLFAHGNAGNISDRIYKLKFFHDAGVNVFIFDYRGFGNSHGKTSERGIYLDAQAAYDYLKSRTDINPQTLIAYGASLGGVTVIDLSLNRPLAALIVDSSITSAKDMAQRLYPYLPTFLMAVKFNSIDKIKQITIPKLFLHSKEDRTVPYAMGLKLFEAAAEPKEFVTIHGGHNDAAIASDPLAREAFTNFLRKYNLL